MSKKKALKNVALLSAGSFAGAAFAFLTQVLLARKLGAASFGTFAAASTTVALLTPLAGFGISQFWLKVFGQEGWGAQRWLRSSFRFTAASTVAVVAALAAWGVAGPHDATMRKTLLLLSVTVAGQVAVELVSSKLQLEERYAQLALWQLLPHLMRFFLVVVLAYVWKRSVSEVVVALAFAAIAMTVALFGLIQLRAMSCGNFDLKGHQAESDFEKTPVRPDVKTTVSQALPFGIAGLFYLIYYQSDIILVKYFTGAVAAGIYNVAFTVMTAVYLLPTVIFQKYLLPKTHRWAAHDRQRFYDVYRQGNIFMIILGSCAMVCIWVCASWGVPLLFGRQYSDAAYLLNILALSAPIFFVAISVGATLVTQEHMKTKVKYMGCVAVFNIVLNLFLVPQYGAVGSSVSTVITNLALLMGYYSLSRKRVFKAEIQQRVAAQG